MIAVAREFLDTNVLIYAFVDDPRAAVAQEILKRGCDISVQVLNEFAHVARRKLGLNWSELSSALAAIKTLCSTIHPLDLGVHERALALSERYRFSIYDAAIVAAALTAGCNLLHSEDMQHGLEVEGLLRINNPFRPTRP